MNWSAAKLFDFTGATANGAQFARFDDQVVQALRQPGQDKLAIILDTAFGWQSTAPAVVRDHINFSGYNPLIGPNHPAGPRFPVVQGIYVSDCAAQLGPLATVVAAGVKPEQKLDADDIDFVHTMGADCYCFNLVPTMLVAAHAGWKLLALVGPDNKSWQSQCLSKIRSL